jgi:hypothetical protein
VGNKRLGPFVYGTRFCLYVLVIGGRERRNLGFMLEPWEVTVMLTKFIISDLS